jgi:hypothetical protein
MPRRKPAGWPDLMTEKRLSTGVIAYYWAPPTRAKKAGYTVTSEALGTDYGTAKKRCDDILNPHYKAWLNKGYEGEAPSNLRIGSFDWLVSVYKASPKYTKLPPETRSSYDRVLRLVSQYRLSDKRAIGFLPLVVFTPAAADALFEKLKINPKGGERVRTAVLAMRVCSRAWKIAKRAEPRRVPSDNPFEKMGLTYRAKPTKLLPLLDDDGNDLWPELTARLDATDRHGTLIITRDAPDRFTGVRLPWKKRHFLRTVSKIRKLAGIDPAIKFMGLRHGVPSTFGGVIPTPALDRILRSIDVAFDFSVSLDYSVTSQSARSLQVPPSNLQIIVQPNPHRARAGFFVLHHCRNFPAIWAMIAGSRSTSVMRGRTDFHQVHRDFSV